MRDPFLVLTGGGLVAGAVILWMILSRKHGAVVVSRPRQRSLLPGLKRPSPILRWQLAGCATLATIGLDIAVVHGIGAPSPAQSGITAELGFAMMLLAVLWSLFRDEVVKFQLGAATTVFMLPTPIDSEQVKAAKKVGAFIRLLLFVLGLFIVLVRLVLRSRASVWSWVTSTPAARRRTVRDWSSHARLPGRCSAVPRNAPSQFGVSFN